MLACSLTSSVASSYSSLTPNKTFDCPQHAAKNQKHRPARKQTTCLFVNAGSTRLQCELAATTTRSTKTRSATHMALQRLGVLDQHQHTCTRCPYKHTVSLCGMQVKLSRMPIYTIFIIAHHILLTSTNRDHDSLPRSQCSAPCTPDLPTWQSLHSISCGAQTSAAFYATIIH